MPFPLEETHSSTSDSAESPEYLRISLAAAITLRLKTGLFFRDARLGCLNLLLTYRDGCLASCAYCGLSRQRVGEFGQKSFIRVEWPAYPLEQILSHLYSSLGIQRICLSMITHPRVAQDSLSIIRHLRKASSLPISLLVAPSSLQRSDIERLHQAGAQILSVAIDGATEELFKRYRTAGGPHRWGPYWDFLQAVAEIFGPGRVGCHLIAGLGETEKEMAEAIQRVKGLGGNTHLFSFYPEHGSALEGKAACPVPHYRRVQLARYLIDEGLASADEMRYDGKERIQGFGLPDERIKAIVRSGRPFETSGCPGQGQRVACNRPYGDGPPSNIRSYPFALEPKDIRSVERQLWNYR